MSRANASLLLSLLLSAWPAFSADPPPGTTPNDEIDPATGLARSTVVRPLADPSRPAAPVPPAPGPRALPPGAVPGVLPAAPNAPTPVPPGPAAPKRPHIALILPTASTTLGKLADAVRQGFLAAAEAGGKETVPVVVTAVDNEAQALVDGCRQAQATGALAIVGGLTRDGATTIATSDCARLPVLALNEPRDALPTVYAFPLSLEHEAKQAALAAVNDGLKSAIVVHTPSPLSRRVEEAFEREWSRAGGEVRRILYTGSPDELAAIRERLANTRADVVFLALDHGDARDVRPYLHAALPVYATSMSVNPRAETLVNLDLQGVRYGEMPWFAQPDHLAVMAYPQPKAPLPLEEERLYAFGIDAFRVAFALLKGDPAKISIDGVTGHIALEAGRVFTRLPQPVEIDGGKLIPLRP